MRILIDALSAQVGGGLTYIRHILPLLVEQGCQHEYLILLSSRYQNDLIQALPPGLQVIDADLPAGPLTRRWWYQQIQLPRLLKQARVDLFFAPAESSYFRVPCAFVMLAHNASVYNALESFWTQRWRLLAYRLVRQPLVFLALHRADRVVFVSKTFRAQVIAQMRLSPVTTRVIYHGLSAIFWQKAAAVKPVLDGQPYFLAVSTVNPHKNYETLLRAYAQLPPSAPHLVIAGKLAHQPTYEVLKTMIGESGLAARVHFLGEVPYDHLPALYQQAVAFVFPSRLESFGLPLIEAMASATPVIASNLPVCQEICGDAALFFAVAAADELAQLLTCILCDGELRTRLVQRGQRRAAEFSWLESARQLGAVFAELE